MRHGKRFNHLGRTPSHRKAMLSNMASSLLVHKRINTTLAKAKELRKYVEPLITKAKSDTTHARRVVFSYLQDKESVNTLFNEVADRVANRPGGYTRIIKLGTRLGDNAEMAMIELVDFNDLLLQEAEPKKAKTRRSRRGSKTSQDTAAAKTEVKAEKEEQVEEAKTTSTDVKNVAEAKVEEVEEKVKDVEAEEAKVEESAETKVDELKEPVKEKKTDKADAEQVALKNDKSVEEVNAKEANKEEESSKEAKDKKTSKEDSKDSGDEQSKN
jgi:large subunit ribosomal protein L17